MKKVIILICCLLTACGGGPVIGECVIMTRLTNDKTWTGTLVKYDASTWWVMNDTGVIRGYWDYTTAVIKCPEDS